jgi:chaperonin GroEL (HSP60 family)
LGGNAKFFQNQYFQAPDQEYEKEKLNERIAKLSGGVAVIQVTLILNM